MDTPSLVALPAKELWHPLVVHLPVALLPLGTFLYALTQLPPFRGFRGSAVVMGAIGSAAGWLALRTGEMAASVVGKDVCNSSLLDAHGQQAETALIFFSAAWGVATFFHLIQRRDHEGNDTHPFIRMTTLFALLLGSIFLLLAGHKGFRLVFEEGVGIRKPLRSCGGSTDIIITPDTK